MHFSLLGYILEPLFCILASQTCVASFETTLVRTISSTLLDPVAAASSWAGSFAKVIVQPQKLEQLLDSSSFLWFKRFLSPGLHPLHPNFTTCVVMLSPDSSCSVSSVSWFSGLMSSVASAHITCTARYLTVTYFISLILKLIIQFTLNHQFIPRTHSVLFQLSLSFQQLELY